MEVVLMPPNVWRFKIFFVPLMPKNMNRLINGKIVALQKQWQPSLHMGICDLAYRKDTIWNF